MSTKAAREAVLEQAALGAARDWAKACRADLALDGRRAAGGWPGTIPEARMRASTQVAKALAERSMSALTHDELLRAARITYDEARRVWHASLPDDA